MSIPTSPIADLTYRNYDGPLAPPAYRWWPIAKMTMRMAVKKKSFWYLGMLSGWWYFVLTIILYVMDLISSGNPNAPQASFFKTLVWKDLFLDAFSNSQLFLLLIALLIGVGAIANDNKTNALLVYLSKPCTKLDYLVGKWVGIFLCLLGVVAAPTLLFFAYCALSYRQYGILSDDPWLILKLLLLFPIAPALHASLSLGISSLFDQGRIAGAAYAALYFIALIFTKMVEGFRIVSIMNGEHAPPITNLVFYFSIDGIIIGLAKDCLGTSGSVMLFGGRGGVAPPPPPAPHFLPFAFAYLVICAGSLLLAYSRIRAVEVIGS
jgi:ABC-2 type transport system permease protein